MFRAIGCLVVALAAGAAGWFLRGYIAPGNGAVADTTVVWQEVTAEGASRAEGKIASLSRTGAGSYVSIGPGDLAAYLLRSETGQLPPGASDLQAGVEGRGFVMRATVRPRDIGDLGVLGPVASLLKETEEVWIWGDFRVVRSGTAEFRVSRARLRNTTLPKALIPRVLRIISPARRAEGASADALPMAIPEHIANIQVVENQILVFGRER